MWMFAFAGVVTTAQDSLSLSRDLMQTTSEVVEIRGSRQLQPFSMSRIVLDTVGTTYAIIAPILNATPGIWMQSGALNTNRISIRGVGNREPFATSKLKAYLDEIPLTNGIGESSIEDISPALLNAIDIWRSPASALWGAGLGGMVHLRSRHPTHNTLSVTLQAGSFGRLRSDATAALRYGKNNNTATLLHFGYLGDNGYRENNQYKRYSTTLLQRWNPSSRFKATLFVHRIALTAFIPSSLGITAFEENPESAAQNWAEVKGNEEYQKWIGGLGWSWNESNKLTYKGSIFITRFDSDEVRPFNVLSEDDRTFGIRNRLTWFPDASSFVSIGFEYQHERYRNITFETLDAGVQGMFLGAEDERRNYINMFVHSEWNPTDRWIVYTGANVNNTRFESSNETLGYPIQVSPVFGVSYGFKPDRIIGFSSVSRGFSPVSISSSMNADGSINRDLKPESGWNGEIGLRFTHPKQLAQGEITFYRLVIDNLVVQKRITPDFYEAINAGETVHNGIEVAYKVTLNPKIGWKGSYTFTDHSFREFKDGDRDFSGNKLTGSAPHTLHNTLSVTLPLISVRIDQHLISRVPITDDNSVYGDASHTIDASVTVPIYAGRHLELRSTLRVTNIFNTRYASMYQINARGFGGSEPRYYYPGRPRAVYLSVVVIGRD